MDIVDARFAFRRKTSDHERRTTTQIGRRYRCTLQSWNTLNERMVTIKANIRAHTIELSGEHEAVLEDVLRNHRTAISKSSQHRELRLHVGRKPRVRQGLDIGRTELLRARDRDRIFGG